MKSIIITAKIAPKNINAQRKETNETPSPHFDSFHSLFYKNIGYFNAKRKQPKYFGTKYNFLSFFEDTFTPH